MQLRKHMLEAHGEGYTCVEHCGRKFSKKRYLDSHLARVRESKSLRQRKMFMFNNDSCELGSGEGSGEYGAQD